MTGVLKVDDIQDAGANSIVSSNGSGTLTFGSFSAPNITASTAILPDASDGAAIGSASLEWSDIFLADGAVINLGDDQDVTLTHVADTGITLNSTNKLMFNDASQFIQGSSATVLSIGATDEIDLTATAVDLNGTLNVSGVATFQATPVFPDGSLALADLDIDGGTDIGAAIVDADLFIVDDGAGGTNRKVEASRIKTYAGFTATTITGTTALAEAPADTDEFIISDAGTLKRIDASFIKNSSTAFAAKLSSAQSVGSGSNTVLQFAAEDFDNGSNFDVSNYRYTTPEAGQYLFHARCYIEWGNAAGEIGRLQLAYNGTAMAIDAMTASGDPTSGSSLRVTSIINADAGVNIDVRLYHNQGASQDADNDPDFTYFTGFKL